MRKLFGLGLKKEPPPLLEAPAEPPREPRLRRVVFVPNDKIAAVYRLYDLCYLDQRHSSAYNQYKMAKLFDSIAPPGATWTLMYDDIYHPAFVEARCSDDFDESEHTAYRRARGL
jgi:hypothetical protein